MTQPTTPTLEPAAARRFASQLPLLEGESLQALIHRAEAWKAQADQKHTDLVRRAAAGANNLRRAVKAWDEALPALHRAIQAAQARLVVAAPVEAPAAAAAAQTAPVLAKARVKGGKRSRSASAAPGEKPLSGLDAAAQVLREAGEPLNAQDLVARILERGLWKTAGKTPAATIYAAMLREVSAKGPQSRFRKVDRGRFAAAG